MVCLQGLMMTKSEHRKSCVNYLLYMPDSEKSVYSNLQFQKRNEFLDGSQSLPSTFSSICLSKSSLSVSANVF